MPDPNHVVEDDEVLIFEDDEVLIEDDDQPWLDGPKLTDNERDIHLLLSATMLRAVLEGHPFIDERELLKVDEFIKPIIRNQVRSLPTNPYDTTQALDAELRKLNRLIVGRLKK